MKIGTQHWYEWSSMHYTDAADARERIDIDRFAFMCDAPHPFGTEAYIDWMETRDECSG